MILTYSNPRFKDLILSGEKIHTIREDKKMRWKPGMKIQHWMGNPRNVKKEPHKFADGECKSVQEIEIMRLPIEKEVSTVSVKIDGSYLPPENIPELATNDGLTFQEFADWFVPESNPVFRGRIIHFTRRTY